MLVTHLDLPNYTPRALPGAIWAGNAVIWQVLTGPNQGKHTIGMIDPDGYRPNVAIVLLNNDGHVFWAQRTGNDGWQFPQGGMNTDETPVEAMYRELREETGLTADLVEVIGSTPFLLGPVNTYQIAALPAQMAPGKARGV